MACAESNCAAIACVPHNTRLRYNDSRTFHASELAAYTAATHLAHEGHSGEFLQHVAYRSHRSQHHALTASLTADETLALAVQNTCFLKHHLACLRNTAAAGEKMWVEDAQVSVTSARGDDMVVVELKRAAALDECSSMRSPLHGPSVRCNASLHEVTAGVKRVSVRMLERAAVEVSCFLCGWQAAPGWRERVAMQI